MSRVVEKSNIQNSVNSTGNCVHYMYGMSGLAKILNTQNCINSTVYLVRKCRECLDFQKISMSVTAKFNKKLCTLYMYGMFGFAEKLYIHNCENSTANYIHCMCGISEFAEKLNIQNCVNSTGNCVHYMCTEGLDLQKN